MTRLPLCSGKVVSLLELLRFYANRFVVILAYLHDWEILIDRGLAERPPLYARLFLGKNRWHSQKELAPMLGKLRALAAECQMGMSVLAIDELIGWTELAPVAKHQLRALRQTIENELQSGVFLFIPYQRQEWFSQPLTGWEAALQTFPDAQEDIEEMNKCFALSRYTAAVFHSLLVVEHGLIKVGQHIGVSDPKPGWDATYRELDRLVRNRAAIPAGLDFNFLEQTKARLDSMKLAWRNKVNHAAGRLAIEKTGFSDVSAEEVIIACRSFMRHLAEGLPK